MRLRARSALRLGDDDPTTPQPNFTVLRGDLDTTVGDREEPFAVDAKRLTATFENAKVTVSDGDGNSAVYVTQGTATATSKATGNSAIVPPGTLQVVRPPEEPLQDRHPASRTRSSKCTDQFPGYSPKFCHEARVFLHRLVINS